PGAVFWSASPRWGTDEMYTVSFSVLAATQPTWTGETVLARCVRPPQEEAPSNQFQPSTDTVTDTETLLIWQKDVAVIEATFAEAQTYCADLTLDGVATWRVPSLKELQTLVDDEKTPEFLHAEQTAFPALGDSSSFWTSTVDEAIVGRAWMVDFREGFTSTNNDFALLAVRCVR
ncbi:MAG TPA: DUF1566 domain-containing protein, partial [Polyangiaceae bacterium]|nr:DUF1566 domain-containing protein [Polyangiaceae bacterium]